jgi:transcriptional regulator with XRE-family HTH domain
VYSREQYLTKTNEGVMVTTEQPRSSRPERPAGYYELRRIIAANIRDHRQRRGWSLTRVANGLAPYLGQMGSSTISAWENSRTDGAKGFTVEEIYALCRVFEITFAVLLEGPRIMDIGEPIGRIAGEEAPENVVKMFGHPSVDEEGSVYGDRYDLEKSWRSYSHSRRKAPVGPDKAPF